MGDSITVGYYGLVGGWRPGLSSGLTTDGLPHDYVGSLSDAYGAHDGVSGSFAASQSSALTTSAATLRPTVAIVGWGVNDIGTLDHTATTVADQLDSILGWLSAVPVCLLQTVIVPQTNDIPAYYARRARVEELNTLLPAVVAGHSHARLVDMGAPPTSDGVHPTSTGYDQMATALRTAVRQELS